MLPYVLFRVQLLTVHALDSRIFALFTQMLFDFKALHFSWAAKLRLRAIINFKSALHLLMSLELLIIQNVFASIFKISAFKLKF